MRWIPDFVLADGTFIEIKGYLTEQARAKFACFRPPLRVCTRAELEHIFAYVHQRCGKNLRALYE
jgi:hypothetical protein